MKNRLMMVSMALLVLLIGCVKDPAELDIHQTTLYKGRVLEKSQNKPIKGVTVSVSDDNHVYVYQVTDNDGCFEFHVNFEVLNENYALHLDCQGYSPVIEELKGMGKEEYDYKDIIFFDNGDSNNWPTITTNAVSDITSTSAKTGGKVIYNGPADITARGVCWSTSHNPTIEENHTEDGIGTGSFISDLANLSDNTRFFVRAYATNMHGTYYGDVKTFATTSAIPIVTLDVNSFELVSSNSISCTSNVISDGGLEVTERGVCWSTLPYPTIADPHTSDGMGTGYFHSILTDMTDNTTYYIRSYATNITETSYSEQFVLSSDYRTYLGFPRMVYYGSTYVIYPDLGGYMSWENAYTTCLNLDYAGYNDWRLPDDYELYHMYLNRETIGGFIMSEVSNSSYYWSNTDCVDGDGHTQIKFFDGSIICSSDNNYGCDLCRIRPVREINNSKYY